MFSPFEPDHLLLPSGLTEGSYTTWTYIHNNPWAWLWTGAMGFVDNMGNMWANDPVATAANYYTRAGAAGAIANRFFAETNKSASFSGRYNIVTRYAIAGVTTFSVYDHCALLFTRNAALDIGTITDVFMGFISPNARYLMVWAVDGILGRIAMLYEA